MASLPSSCIILSAVRASKSSLIRGSLLCCTCPDPRARFWCACHVRISIKLLIRYKMQDGDKILDENIRLFLSIHTFHTIKAFCMPIIFFLSMVHRYFNSLILSPCPPNPPTIFVHNSTVYLHSRNRCCTFSSFLKHKMQIPDPYYPLFFKLSHVRIIFFATNHKNACILEGAFNFHIASVSLSRILW